VAKQDQDPQELRLADGRAALGAQVRAVRIRRGHANASAFAERAGITRAYLSNIENGHRLPTLDVLLRIADALGTSVSSLLRTPPWGKGPTA
jgi:transcriptional regulator with XRE-family HTH domain